MEGAQRVSERLGQGPPTEVKDREPTQSVGKEAGVPGPPKCDLLGQDGLDEHVAFEGLLSLPDRFYTSTPVHKGLREVAGHGESDSNRWLNPVRASCVPRSRGGVSPASRSGTGSPGPQSQCGAPVKPRRPFGLALGSMGSVDLFCNAVFRSEGLPPKIRI
jgi:hypothetical protein